MISLYSPVPGIVVEIRKKSGERVSIDEVILVIETMKLEIPIYSDRPGYIVDMPVSPGTRVKKGDLLLTFNEE